MSIHPRRRLSKFLLPAIAVGSVLYFVYHLIQGNHGWIAWRSLETNIKTSKHKLETLQKEQESLKNKVSLLRSESLDEDLLDERIRFMLGNSRESEIIIMEEEENLPVDEESL